MAKVWKSNWLATSKGDVSGGGGGKKAKKKGGKKGGKKRGR